MTDGSTIVGLAPRGDGVTNDGRFVPNTAPGDQVLADGSVVAGPHRQTPPCRHFPECGGCQLQQVDDSAYSAWVGQRILAALRPQGIAPAELMPTHLSPPNTRRRASLRALRRGRRVVIGFNAEASHRVVDMHECHILRPELFALVAPLRALLVQCLPDGQSAGVVLTAADNGVDLQLANLAAPTLAVIEQLTDFARAHDLARLSIELAGGVDVIAEPRAPIVRLGGVDVVLPPAPFLQATRDGEAALQAAVLAASAGASTAADLFCGVGTFALPLSASMRVLAADAAMPAVAALQNAARMTGRQLLAVHRDLFRKPLTAAELKRVGVVVFDPPRAGAADQVREIAAAKVPRVVAISCNPNTFARDAAVLVNAGYRLGRLWPVGQFRWSTHVELAAEFVRPEKVP